jgi:hypothetical protein
MENGNPSDNNFRSDIFQKTWQAQVDRRLGILEKHEQGTKVQYLYPLSPVSSFDMGVSGSFGQIPMAVLNNYASTVGAAIIGYFGNGISGYGYWSLLQSNASIPIFIPSNIVVNKVTVTVYVSPLVGFSQVDGSGSGVGSQSAFYQVHGMKAYVAPMSSVVPVTFMTPLTGIGASQGFYDVPNNALSNAVFPPSAIDISSQILGASSLNITNDSALHVYTGDVTSNFTSGDAKIITFIDTATSNTVGSGSTVQAYAILEGYVHNR